MGRRIIVVVVVVVVVVLVVVVVFAVVYTVVVIVVLGQLTQRHGWLASRPQGRLSRPLNQPAKFKGNDTCPFLLSSALLLSKLKQDLVVFFWTNSIS